MERPQRSQPGPLVPSALRPVAAALLIVCVAATVSLIALFAHHRQPGALDAAVDARIQAGVGGQRKILNYLAELGDPTPFIAMIATLCLACLVTRRWRGAALVALAVPAAAGISDLILKPLTGRTLLGDLSFPSGHETGVFALAAAFAVLMASPVWPRIPASARLCLGAAVLLTACAVAVALVGLGRHYFTDTIGGAAVGTAVVLATALILDRLATPGPRARARLPDV